MPKLASHHDTATLVEVRALPFYKTFAASATAACVGEVSTQLPLSWSGLALSCHPTTSNVEHNKLPLMRAGDHTSY